MKISLLKFTEIEDRIFCDLLTDEKNNIPNDAVILSVAGVLKVFFYVDVSPEFSHEETPIVISREDMKCWKTSLEKLREVAIWNLGDVVAWDWPKIQNDVKLYVYPDADTHWIVHIIEPGCLLEHSNISGKALIMIPDKNTVLLTGSNDLVGQKLLLEKSKGYAKKNSPITKSPLVIDDKWESWTPYPCEENPFSNEYARLSSVP